MVLIPGPGVDPDGPQPTQSLRVCWRHPDRIPVEPTLPYGRPEHPGHRVERQVDRTVRLRGEARRHAEHLQQGYVLFLGEGHPRGEVLPPPPDVAVVTAQMPDGGR